MSDSAAAFTINENGDIYYGRASKGLENIYKALGCEGIEAVRLKDAIMYIDEEGKLKETPRLNKVATILAWMHGLPVRDWITGNVIIFGTISPSGEIDGEDYDCPEYIREFAYNFIDLTEEEVDSILNTLRWAIAQAEVVERQTR